MTILFLHGWRSVPGGVKPTFLANRGHHVINPRLDDDDFELALASAQAAFDRDRPDAVVGSSRGGAVAMNLVSGTTPLVLLCPVKGVSPVEGVILLFLGEKGSWGKRGHSTFLGLP